MSLGDTFEADLIKLITQATAIANIADNAATSPLASLFVALHTADPGEAGTQSTSETTYTGYARQPVTRASGAGGWTVSTSTASNTSAVTFGACTAGTPTITHASIGVAVSGAGTKLLVSGALSASLAVSPGITPSFAAGALTFSFD